MTVSDSQLLPREAEQFLARLGELSPIAWREIIARDREPLVPTIKKIIRGLWLSIMPARFRLQSHYSPVAAERLKRLAETGALPMGQLGWRGYHAAGSALQALCLRGFFDEESIRKLYAPFETQIPLGSLNEPGAPSNSGVAGA